MGFRNCFLFISQWKTAELGWEDTGSLATARAAQPSPRVQQDMVRSVLTAYAARPGSTWPFGALPSQGVPGANFLLLLVKPRRLSSLGSGVKDAVKGRLLRGRLEDPHW